MTKLPVVLVLMAAVVAGAPARAVAQRATSHRAHGIAQLRLARTVPVRVTWRASDVALAGAFTAALLIDARQTRTLARGGWRDYHESNPILGPRPSVGRVNSYTAVAGLTLLGAAAVAPKRVRPWVLGAALAVEAFALATMSRNGIAIRIP